MQAYDNFQEAAAAFNDADYLTFAQQMAFGLANTAGAFAGLRLGLGGCFAAGTPILTPDGSKPIEEFQPGDWVLTAPDDDSDAEPVPRQVEETFVNYLPLLDLYVNGRTIRTTAEHPFWVRDHGWVAAQQLEAGDEIRTHDDRWIKIDGLEGPKPSAPVYNMCVAEYHTYFIGHQIWGFSVWSHNAQGICAIARPQDRTFCIRPRESAVRLQVYGCRSPQGMEADCTRPEFAPHEGATRTGTGSWLARPEATQQI